MNYEISIEKKIDIINEILFIKLGRRLNDVETATFKGSWEGQTYEEIALNSGYAVSYLKQSVGPQLWKMLTEVFEENLSKTNFKSVIERQWRVVDNSNSLQFKQVDWGEAFDVSVFYGRIQEISTLEEWILKDRCRLVTILGIGGIGKTALAIKWAQQAQHEFKYVIWRSLRNAPPLEYILNELIDFLRGEPFDLSQTIDANILKLIDCLQNHRCLLVLDNAESILQSKNSTGSYLEGYEGYGQLLRCIAETPHQSTLILTSREQPKILGAKEGNNLPIRSMQIEGLNLIDIQHIFKLKGKFAGTESDWELLLEYYAGNPLKLKIVSTMILNLFDGDLEKFISCCKKEIIVAEDISNLIENQLQRLTYIEKRIVYCLALKEKPLSIEELSEDFFGLESISEIINALASLKRRSLIIKAVLPQKLNLSNSTKVTNAIGFTTQPIIMEYIRKKFK